MFSFRMPSPEYSKTVSERELLHIIERMDTGCYTHKDFRTVIMAARRMIEMAKASPPKLKLNPSKSIRDQIGDLLREIGLEPSRFLNNPDKDIKPMCGTEGVSNLTDKQVAEQAARELGKMLHDDLGVQIPATMLRLWLAERWDRVAPLAHKIHVAK